MNLPPVIILVGGLGTRVSHISGELPKCMIPINEKPFLLIQLELLLDSGFNHIIYSVKHEELQIRNYLNSLTVNNVKIEVISDGPTLLGTGGAVKKCSKYAGAEFFVMYGDSYLEMDYREFYNFASPFISCMAIFKNENKFEKSNVRKLEDLKISYEKGFDDSSFEFVDYGITYFKESSFDNFAIGEKFDLADCLKDLSDSGNLIGFEIHNRFYEIGSEEGIKALENHLKGDMF